MAWNRNRGHNHRQRRLLRSGFPSNGQQFDEQPRKCQKGRTLAPLSSPPFRGQETVPASSRKHR